MVGPSQLHLGCCAVGACARFLAWDYGSLQGLSSRKARVSRIFQGHVTGCDRYSPLHPIHEIVEFILSHDHYIPSGKAKKSNWTWSITSALPLPFKVWHQRCPWRIKSTCFRCRKSYPKIPLDWLQLPHKSRSLVTLVFQRLFPDITHLYTLW